MPTYSTPGVYFEWVDTRRDDVVGVRTDIAGFVGYAVRGPLHKPTRIESWNQFVTTFGGYTPQAYLAYAVQGFFNNGGRRCWIVRVADLATASAATVDLSDSNGQKLLTLQAYSPGTWGNQLTVSTANVGQGRFCLMIRLPDGTQEFWSNLSSQPDDARFVETLLNDGSTGSRLVQVAAVELVLVDGVFLLNGGTLDLKDSQGQKLLTLLASGAAGPGGLKVSISNVGNGRFNLTIQAPDGTEEFWPDLSFLQDDPHYVETVLNDPTTGSRMVRASFSAAQPVPPLQTGAWLLQGGKDGLAGVKIEQLTGEVDTVQEEDKGLGLSTLEFIDEIAIVAMPDAVSAPPASVVFKVPPLDCALLDQPATLIPTPTSLEFAPGFDPSELQLALIRHCEKLKDRVAILDPPTSYLNPEAILSCRQQFDTGYAALYYPWVKVPDPLGLEGLLRTIPPSGHVAGVYAQVERRVGPHKPPANELLENVEDVSYVVGDTDHGFLNQQNINVIRPFNGQRIRVAGARTLTDPSDTQWQFVNVRRLLIMIERSIQSSTQWTVFEPNNPALWLEIDRVVRSFLDSLWRSGFLDGATAEEAYSVKCDSTTNPPAETDNGRAICEIGVQPPWPAEFVIVRIGITPSGAEVLNAMEAQSA